MEKHHLLPFPLSPEQSPCSTCRWGDLDSLEQRQACLVFFLHIRAAPFLCCCHTTQLVQITAAAGDLMDSAVGRLEASLMPQPSQLHLSRAMGSKCQSKRKYILYILFNPWSYCSSSKKRGGGRTKKYLAGVGSRAAKDSKSDNWSARCRWNKRKAFKKGPFNFTAYSRESKKILKFLVCFHSVSQDLKIIGSNFQLIVNFLLS